MFAMATEHTPLTDAHTVARRRVRADPRYRCHMNVWVVDDEGALLGQLENISETGALLTQIAAPPGAQITLTFLGLKQPLELTARVVRVSELGLGLHFNAGPALERLRGLLPRRGTA